MTRRGLLALAATGAFGADALRKAPISRDALNVKLPEPVITKFGNGAALIAVDDNRLPIAQVRYQVEGAGAIYTPKPGVSELTAVMLREGAGSRSGKQIGDEAARLGATIATSATPGAEVVVADGSGLTGHFAEWLDLLNSVVLHPTFPADDFNSLRERWLVRARVQRTQATTVAGNVFLRVVYGSHPAAVTSATAQELAALTPETLAAWHRERYTPGKMVITCVGRVRPSDVASQMEKLLGGWKPAEVSHSLPPPPQPAVARRVVLVDMPGAAQTELHIGGLSMERRDPDYIAATVLFNVLGGGIGSRLFRILRDEKGYAFAAGSVLTAYRFPGFWRVVAAVRTDTTADSLSIILEQLRRLCDEPIPADELNRAKAGAVGNFAMNLEQPAQLMNLFYLRYRYGFSTDYWERYPAKLAACTAQEIQAVARKYMNPEQAHIIAVGDAAKIRGALEKYGKVES
jgi:predicted Zn-dependent peptidase